MTSEMRYCSRLGLSSSRAVNEQIVMMQKAYGYLSMTIVNECQAGNARGIHMSIRSTITMKQKKRPGVTGATIVEIHYMFLYFVSTWGSVRATPVMTRSTPGPDPVPASARPRTDPRRFIVNVLHVASHHVTHSRRAHPHDARMRHGTCASARHANASWYVRPLEVRAGFFLPAL